MTGPPRLALAIRRPVQLKNVNQEMKTVWLIDWLIFANKIKKYDSVKMTNVTFKQTRDQKWLSLL